MRKMNWKKRLSLLMAVTMLCTVSVPARAAEVAKIGIGTESNTATVPYLKQLDKKEWYPVTEQQISDYEKTRKKKIGKASIADVNSAEGFAETKADVFSALYGEYSVQYALIDNGEITLSGQSGFANIKEEKKPTKDSMYGIGSISKIFASTAIMQLVDEGKIDLDKPVVDYVKDFKMLDSRYKEITVRMLLNHSSGLMGSSFSNALLFNDSDTVNHDEFLNILKKQRLKADPGAYSVYCNDGFTLAEIVVERVTNQSFTEYIQKNICKPLKLSNTKTPQDKFDKNKMATAYEGIDEAVPLENFNAIGAGGIYSSAEDLCHLATAYMDNGNKNILSEVSKEATMNRECDRGMWKKTSKETVNYGLGWDSVELYPFSEYGIQALAKGGDTLYYHGSLIVLPELNMAVAVLSADGNSSLNEVLGQGILLRYLKEKGKISSLPTEGSFASYVNAQVHMPADLKENSGYYTCFGGTLKVSITEDGILDLRNVYGVTGQKYTYCGDGKFVDEAGTTVLSFVKEANGKTYLWAEGYSTLPTIGQIYSASYQAQKVEENPLSQKVKDAWEKRNDKLYLVTSEKYSSICYNNSQIVFSIALPSDLEGYINDAKIVNGNLAVATEQIPNMYGRDLRDLDFYKKGKVEYLDTASYTAISEDGIGDLPEKSKFSVTIGKDGQAKWYKIGKNSANKKVKFAIPAKASFAVYDEDFECLTHSYISNKKTITLPENGFIVFAGEKNKKITAVYNTK
ncbi:serine hydrolase domain-containing protein [Velocimicrobium porci]|uniref:Beta-lactamase family protein n=1 Tax=Velocimicrobium porci TaxID=2606634 RepID=A0A6L5XWU7_9FIRM|nr:serine hydrolase domain-containing protein [Velocimicrobium porci]MSS63265.1 beta-lactamase family protein [Velocimicrobium porci]